MTPRRQARRLLRDRLDRAAAANFARSFELLAHRARTHQEWRDRIAAEQFAAYQTLLTETLRHATSIIP